MPSYSGKWDGLLQPARLNGQVANLSLRFNFSEQMVQKGKCSEGRTGLPVSEPRAFTCALGDSTRNCSLQICLITVSTEMCRYIHVSVSESPKKMKK